MTDEQLQDFRFRDTTRAPYQAEVNVRYDRFGGDVVAETADISMEGMFIRSDEPRPVGTLVQFEISLGDGQELVQGLGDVVWIRVEAQGVERPKGMGIQFRYIDTASRERIRRIVASYIESEGAPAAASPASASPVEVAGADPVEEASQESAPATLAAPQLEDGRDSAGVGLPGVAAGLAGLGALSAGESESFVDDDHDVEEIDFGATVQLPPGAASALASDDSAKEPPDFLAELASRPPEDRAPRDEASTDETRGDEPSAEAAGGSLLDGIDLPDPASAATTQIPTAPHQMGEQSTEQSSSESPAAGDVLSMDLESDGAESVEAERGEAESLEAESRTDGEAAAPVDAAAPASELPTIGGVTRVDVEQPTPDESAASSPPVAAQPTVEVDEPAAHEPPPSSEWDDLLAEKPSRSGLYWLLGAIALLAVFAVLGRERIAALIDGQPPPAPVEVAQAPAAGTGESRADAVEPASAEAEEAPPVQQVAPSDPADPNQADSTEAESIQTDSTQADSLQADSTQAEPTPEESSASARAPSPQTPPTPQGTGQAPGPTDATGFRLLGVSAESDDSGTTVFLRVDSPVPAGAVRYSRLNSPPRYVVKVRGTDSRPAIDVATAEVQQIRTGLHDVGGVPEVHLVFDLTTEELDIEPSAEGQLVRIRLSKR